MKDLLFAGLALALAGCAALPAPLGDQNIAPHLEANMFVTRDDTRLPLSVWDAQGPAPKAIILGLHGMSDYANAFAIPAKVWAAAGITTLAYDQRGFGRGPAPGSWAGGARLRADLDDFAIAARARYPGVKLYALGESMGGAVLLTALAKAPPLIDGAILVSPAVWSRPDMPLSYRVTLFLADHLLPGLILSNDAAARVVTVVASDNVAMLRALGRDPYFQKRTSVAALYGLVNLMDAARQAPAGLENPPPMLVMTGGKDQIVPKPSREALIAALDARATTLRYPQGYHMLLRDLDGPRRAQDVADWVLEHAGQGATNRAASRYLPWKQSPESGMNNGKKSDLRDDKNAPVKGDVNSEAKLAGHDSNKDTIKSPSGFNPVTPDVGNIPAGQGTKS